ncbi:MAG: TonB-dependent receptor, partial [Pseudomonadota bacterium]
MARQPGNTVDFWTLATAFTLSTTLGFAEEIQIVDVPAQPLPAAIAELSEETDVEVMAAAEALSGQVSSQVKGPMSLQKALDTMLIGTGLAASTIAEDSYVVSRNFVSQNSIEEEPFDLGTLVVSGELIERNVQESQTSAVVISGEELERRSDPGLINTLERTPGVTIAGAARVPSVRGVNQRGPSANGAATISLAVDGAAISDFGLLVENGPFSVWDLEQVEILRGPQSTQSGRNALAGAINIRSRDPFMGEEYKVRLEAGSRATTG